MRATPWVSKFIRDAILCRRLGSIVVLLSALFVSQPSFALYAISGLEVEERAPMPTEQLRMSVTPYHSLGYRVAFVKPMLGVSVESGGSRILDGQSVQANGLSFGYTSIPVRSFGVAVDLAAIDLYDVEHVGLGRLAFNFGYGLDSRFAVKAGPNVSTLFGQPGLDSVRPNFGFQIAGTYQPSKHFGIDLGLVQMAQSFSGSEVIMTGLELGLSGTF